MPDFAQLRHEMVQEQLVKRGIQDPRVLQVMEAVERHRFVPERLIAEAYTDKALPLGVEQTISQPFIIAYGLEALHLTKDDRVLEVGTGSGYQSALLAELAGPVFSLDLDQELVRRARTLLDALGYENVTFSAGNGWDGWQEKSPFDVIVVSAAAESIPRELVRQLAPNGRMLVPIGEEEQVLVLLSKENGSLKSEELCGVRFVPLQKNLRR